MANIYNVGGNVGAVWGLPWEEGRYAQSEASFKDFSNQLNGLKYKHLLAITANLFQGRAGTVLSQNGFKPYVTFNSSHDTRGETLTIWVKTRPGKIVPPKTKINLPGWNCSVTFNRNINYRCKLTVKKNKADILPNGFVQIPKTPIYYKIAEGQIVGLKLKKGKKDLGQLKPVNLF